MLLKCFCLQIANERHHAFLHQQDHKGQARYIATQHPLHETADDFWQMVWEQKSHLVVMVNEEEKEKPVFLIVLSFNCYHFSLYDSRDNDNEGNYWDIFKHKLVVKYGRELAINFLYYLAMLSISIFSFLKHFLAFFL